MEEVEKIIDNEKYKIKHRKINKNLFGEAQTQSEGHYKEMLFVHQSRPEHLVPDSLS